MQTTPHLSDTGAPGVALESVPSIEHWPDPQALAAAIATIPVAPEPGRALPAARPPTAGAPKWNRTENLDGSAKVTVDSRLGTAWETKVGVDFGLAQPLAAAPQPDLLAAPRDASSGAAWAQVAVPRLPFGWDAASIDARLDPVGDQGKLSTTFSRTVPITGDLTLTLQNSYSVTQTLAGSSAAATQAAPNALAGGAPSQVWGTERALKFKLLPTDTTFSASTALSSADNQWHHQIGAEQKIFGPLNVTTSVTDPGSTGSNKKITAGFSKTW